MTDYYFFRPLIQFFIFLCIFSSANAKIQGQILAYIDINADTFTDLIVNTSSNSLAIYVASEKEAAFTEDANYRLTFPNSTITNIGVGDFNGDSYPDLAVSLFSASINAPTDCGNAQNIQVCYATKDLKFLCKPLVLNGTSVIVCEHPLVLDCNFDQWNDLLTTIIDPDGRLVFACFQALGQEGFELIAPFTGNYTPPATPPTSNAFVDVSGDLNPEIVLWKKNEKPNEYLVELQVLQYQDHKWINATEFTSPPLPNGKNLLTVKQPKDASAYVLGQSVYDDFNKDGLVDHLLPFCLPDSNGECQSISIYVWVKNNWFLLNVPLVDQYQKQWTVYLENWGTKGNRRTFHVRSGDYTQDGYPDLLVVLKQDTKRAAFLLANVDCPAGEVCKDSWKRTFDVSWNAFGGGTGDLAYTVTTAGFFDLTEDGTLDILLEYGNDSRRESSTLDFVTSNFEGDTTFLKVQVFTAICSEKCRYEREGSAISLPGAALIYSSQDTAGNPILGSYTQRSISAYKSLLLPYALFGLGRTPNFVEKLRVGVPTWPPCNRTWEQLVPNSRIYVVPYPPDHPQSWIHRLYLTPSKLIIYSLISLSSVCGIIIIIVFGLHMQERHMDKKERELQRERFHFDAM